MMHLLADGEGGFWFGPQASNFAEGYDALFMFIYWVSVIFFALIVGAMVLFVVKYRRTKERPHAERTPSHNTALELTWSIVPAILCVIFFYWGWVQYLDMRTPPGGAMQVQVGAYKWGWNFTYPNGFTSNELHVPQDEEVVLVMTSADVLHSFWVPEFRTKQDIVPGRYTKLWFIATREGEYQLKCTEYCGTDHSGMRARVVVHPEGGYEEWLYAEEAKIADLPPLELGEYRYNNSGCKTCHSLGDGMIIGPGWKGIWGTTRKFADGSTAVVDENYIRQSILEPNSQIVEGYAPGMPPQPTLTERDIAGIIEFIKSLSEPKQ